MTHPFHPLKGQRLPWLKRRVLDGVPFVQLRVGEDSISLPEEWTDAGHSAGTSVSSTASILSPKALADLIDLITRMKADGA